MTNNPPPPIQINEEAKQLGPIGGLDAIWSKIATFTLLWWIYWFVFEVSGEPIAEIIAFRKHNDSAPLFALLLGNFLTLISFLILAWRVRETANRSRLARLPPLWFDIQLGSRVGRTWKWFTIFSGIFLPIVFEAYFWVRFHEREAWPNTTSAEALPKPWVFGCWPPSATTLPKKSWGLWCYVTPSHLVVHSNDFRYGFDDPQRWNVPSGPASFIPLWEPLIFALLSAATLVAVWLLVRGLVTPATARRKPRRRR